MKISALGALPAPHRPTCQCVTPALFRAVLTLPMGPQIWRAHRQPQPAPAGYRTLKLLELELLLAGLVPLLRFPIVLAVSWPWPVTSPHYLPLVGGNGLKPWSLWPTWADHPNLAVLWFPVRRKLAVLTGASERASQALQGVKSHIWSLVSLWCDQ